ncbi:MAG: DUF4157 domain-containing protein [Cyanobacteria bacterium P01_A01_bin.80]
MGSEFVTRKSSVWGKKSDTKPSLFASRPFSEPTREDDKVSKKELPKDIPPPNYIFAKMGYKVPQPVIQREEENSQEKESEQEADVNLKSDVSADDEENKVDLKADKSVNIPPPNYIFAKMGYKVPQPVIQREEENSQEKESEQEADVNLKSDVSADDENKEENINLKPAAPTASKQSEDEDNQSIQTKLTVGKPGDKYEQEADATAAKVMGMSDETLQRQSQEETEDIQTQQIPTLNTSPITEKGEEEQEIQTKGKGNNTQPSSSLESRLGSSKGGGSPLADDVRGFMEPRFGADFSNVRVHNDSSAVQMNKELGAQAFAHGNDIYYGAGKSPGNNELTAHELTHTIQQTGGVGLQKPPQIKEIGEDKQQSQSPLEKSQQEPLKAKQVDNNNSSKANSNKEKSEITENKPEKESLKAKQIGKDSAEVKPKQNSQVEEKVNQSTVENASQNPAEVTNSTATNNVTKASTSASGNAAMAIGGGQESAPVPQEAAPITAENPGQILEQLKNTPPTQAVSTYAQAQTASAQALEKQKQQLQETIPEIPAPTGLPAKESESQKAGEKVAQQAAITKQAPDDKLGATTSGGEKAKYETSVPEAPPAPPITATQLAGGKVEQEGKSDQALSRSAQNALNSVNLNTSQINTSAGDRPSVDLTGEADPSQINATQAQSTQEVQAAKAQPAQGITQDFGENSISPKASNETLKANKELSAVAAPGGKSGETPALSGEVVGGLNQSLSPFLREKIGVEQEKYQVGKDKFDTDSTKARTDADKEIGQLTEETKQKQLEKRQLAQTEVAQAKQEWQTELDNAELDYQQKAGKATQEQQQKIGQEKTKGETQAAKHLVEAEQKAEAEKQKADNEAAKKKEEGKKESGGFWGWAKSAAKTLIDGVKQAVNFVYDNLRKAVKAIFEAAKQLAMAAIDLARNAIVGLIKAYGEILKGLVRVVFAAFPGIAKKITAKIDQAVNKAVQAVNAAADLLKKGISAVLDFLANTLDQLLGLIQDLYNGIFTVIGMIINGELKELLAKIGNLIAAAKAAPPQFETAGLEELLGGNLDESLSSQELSQAAAMGINIPTQEGGSNAQVGESNLPSPPWTQENVGVDAVENNMELSPELVTQLMAQTNGDGEVMLGESNDESRSMESIISEATGQQQQEDGKEQAKNPDDGLSPRQRADIKWQMMKQGIAKWWSENWPLVIGGTTAAIGGFIALNVVTGGAITAALPPIMSVLTPLFAGVTIATIGGHIRDYLAKGWEGDIQGGGKSLAKGLAAGAIELVSWLTFKAGGAALKGAKAAARGAKAVARGGIQLAKKATQAVIRGAKYVIQKGKVLFKGIAGSGIGKQFKRLQDLGQGLLERMRFKAFRIRFKNRRFKLEGLINPWILLAKGTIVETDDIPKDARFGDEVVTSAGSGKVITPGDKLPDNLKSTIEANAQAGKKDLTELFGIEPGKNLNLERSSPDVKSYITYVFKNAEDEIVYVGKASFKGTPKQALARRLSRGHDHYSPDLKSEIIATQSSKGANAGAEEFFKQSYQKAGANLTNVDEALDMSRKSRREKSIAKIDEFIDSLDEQ